jgi:hypothetical protein
LQVHIITHCIVVTASNCRLCYGCNVVLRTLLLPTVMILGFYDFCHGLSKWCPCYMSSLHSNEIGKSTLQLITVEGLIYQFEKWLSDKLEVSFMKKSVQLSSRSNNPPTFSHSSVWEFSCWRWVPAKMILHQDLFWGILH